MDVGHTISRTFGVVKERFGLLLGMWAVFFALQIVLAMLLAFGMGASAVSGLAIGNSNALGGGMIFTIFLFYIVYFMIYFAQLASMIAVASPLQRLDFSGAFNVGLRSAPTLLGVYCLLAVAYIIVALVFGLLGGILSMAGTAGVGILIILIVPVAIYLICRVSTVNAVVAVERIGNPITAIARSWSITNGKVLAIFAVMLIFTIAAFAAMALVFVPFYASVTSAMTAGTAPNFGSLGFVFVGIIVIGILVTVVMSALLAVIHEQVSGRSSEDMSTVFA